MRPIIIVEETAGQIYGIVYLCAEQGRRKFGNIMELFHSRLIEGGICTLDRDEAAHCVKVLRHRTGDCINVIDGRGTLYRCRLVSDSPKDCRAEILESEKGWGSHPYKLTLAVCPTKNNERYEWFVEKATEIGVGTIVPVIGDHSERKVYKTERAGKIALSAAKQSLKASIPFIPEPCSVKDFILASSGDGEEDKDGLKLIACCFEDEEHPRTSIAEALGKNPARNISILIGPEGDFSRDEASLAISHGFIPVHLGSSRLRTETAGVTAAMAVYFHHMD